MADDYSFNDVATPAQPPAARAAANGDDYSLDDIATPGTPPPATHPTEAPSGNALADAGNFLRTAAIHAGSGLMSLIGGADPTTRIAAGIAKPDQPIPAPASPNQIDDAAFKTALGPEYQPQTEAGRLAMGATSGAIAGAATGGAGVPAFLANIVRGGVAGGAGQGAADLGLPGWMGPAATAFLELVGRAGLGAAQAGAPAAAAVKQAVTNPTAAGANAAGRALATVDNSGAALPAVSNADLANAQTAVKTATDAIGPGDTAANVGAQIRTDLTGQQKALADARTNATAPLAVARDASMAPIDLDPVTGVIAQKLRTAAGAQATALNGALGDLKMPSGEYRANADQMPAARQAIGARITAAKDAGDNATAGHLLDVQHALDAQVNAAVPEAGQFNSTYASASRPLDVFQPGQSVDAVPNVVSRDNFGNFNGTPLSEVADSFLRGTAVKEKLDQLVTGYGGNQAAAEGALTQHLAGVAQQAIDPITGQLNQTAFARVMAPYQKALNGNGGVWFPQLRKNFADAQAAQNTLVTLSAQKSVGDSIASGGLRGDAGHITANSFNGWLSANEDAITRAQGPQALARLQQIGNALKVAGKNGGTATAIEDAVPAVAGTLTGGADFGILGSMIGGKVTRALMSPWTNRYANAFNTTLERAVRDPAFARDLVSKLPKGTPSPLQTLQAFGTVVRPALTTAPRTAAVAGLLAAPTERQ